MSPVIQERFPTWRLARLRMEQVQMAGYRAYAVQFNDPGDHDFHVRVNISAGKHADLGELPAAPEVCFEGGRR